MWGGARQPLPQRPPARIPCLVSTEKSAKDPVVGQEGTRAPRKGHSSSCLGPALLWAIWRGGAVGRCCVSEGTPPALSRSPSRVTSEASQRRVPNPPLPEGPLGLALLRRCALTRSSCCRLGAAVSILDEGPGGVPESPGLGLCPPLLTYFSSATPSHCCRGSFPGAARPLAGVDRPWIPEGSPFAVHRALPWSGEERGPNSSLEQANLLKAPALATRHSHCFSSPSPAEYSTGRLGRQVGLR